MKHILAILLICTPLFAQTSVNERSIIEAAQILVNITKYGDVSKGINAPALWEGSYEADFIADFNFMINLLREETISIAEYRIDGGMDQPALYSEEADEISGGLYYASNYNTELKWLIDDIYEYYTALVNEINNTSHIFFIENIIEKEIEREIRTGRALSEMMRRRSYTRPPYNPPPSPPPPPAPDNDRDNDGKREKERNPVNDSDRRDRSDRVKQRK